MHGARPTAGSHRKRVTEPAFDGISVSAAHDAKKRIARCPEISSGLLSGGDANAPPACLLEEYPMNTRPKLPVRVSRIAMIGAATATMACSTARPRDMESAGPSPLDTVTEALDPSTPVHAISVAHRTASS
jgi:hypothetical protein